VTYFFDLQDVTRNDLRCLDLLKPSITEDGSLQGKSLLEFFDDGTSLEFLNETDTSVKQEERANDTKVDPVLKPGGENGGSLSQVR